MNRKCTVCAGKGYLWGTPDLTNTETGGLNVTCWRCVGTGNVRDDRDDIGEAL